MARRVWMLAAACLLGLSSAASSPVRAQEVPNVPNVGTGVWSDHIWFQGNAVVTADGDGDNGIDILGDGGTFSFTTNTVAGVPIADCVSDPAEINEPVEAAAGPCFVNGDGNFINEVCGTGAANGTATVTGPEPGTARFVAWFNAGVGVIEGTWFDATEGSAEPFTGTVHLEPTGAPSGDDCTHSWSMVVFIDAFEPPSGS